ncbi:DUF433 domain-containing protein [cf. Phormidesmis sp. LEGE 11477]|uniref:DUF433 domain-containing protein n=1 Tax=cf. Phormidesmis sp. LEGE 11477 TaxID=1828680 RepID=UPI001D14E64B|nr:DUF433 domain-containing protein [cf. Phormidesmis sp. LEGE 11477]
MEQLLIERQIIHCDSEIMSGTPVFTGTRVPLQTFFDYLEADKGLAEFLEDFPHLRKQVFQILEITLREVLEKTGNLSARSA